MADDYNVLLQDSKALEKNITADLRTLKAQIDTNENTTRLEQQILKDIGTFKTLQNKLSTTYKENKFGLPQKEFSRRTTDIHNMLLTIDRLENNVKGWQTKKYQYKGGAQFDKPFEENDATRQMSNQQLYKNQQDKLKRQDEQIGEMIGMTKQGKEIGKAIKSDLENQNKLLDEVDQNMDKVQSRMERTKKKFDDYIQNSSNTCLFIIIGIELAVLVFILIKVGKF